MRFVGVALFLVATCSLANLTCAGQTGSPKPEPELPDSPQLQNPAQGVSGAAEPCHAKGANTAKEANGTDPASAAASGGGSPTANPSFPPATQAAPCPPLLHLFSWYTRFTNGPGVKPLTPEEKAWLAVRNVVDPFNGLTILASSAIAVGFDAHSPYGPGMNGFGRYVGVSYAQDMTGEFFNTFLIPSVMHQDPRYHRQPNATMKRRIAHCIYQVVWTQGDDGKGMVNYGNVVGYAIDDEISNLYVPGRETNLPASAARYGIGLATAPIDNFVSEFLPDVARHVHVQIVVIQRIINQVAKMDAANGQP